MKSYTVYLIRHGMTDEGGEGKKSDKRKRL